MAPEEQRTDLIQRAVSIEELETSVEAAPGASSPNVEELAQKVYNEIRRRLSVEFERWRRIP